MKTGLVIALVVLVIFSGFFSATETAYTSFSSVRMRRFAQKKRSARLALRLSEDYNRVLTTLLIGNNIVNLTASTIGTLLFVALLGEGLGATVSTVVITVVVLIFGEITPKTLAKEIPERFACFAAYPIMAFTYLFLPLSFLFGLWKKLVFRIFRLNKEEPALTEAEFKMLVTDVREDGVLNETEHELINRTLRYDELHVGSCMIPLDRVVCVDVRENYRRVYKFFRETNFSRLPVYEGRKENVVGILYRADFYENLLAGHKDFAPLIRPVSYTEEGEKVSALMQRMQKAREHMMMVGEEGRARGLITREDMIEELLGDVDDKYDLTPVTAPLNPVVPEAEEETEEE